MHFASFLSGVFITAIVNRKENWQNTPLWSLLLYGMLLFWTKSVPVPQFLHGDEFQVLHSVPRFPPVQSHRGGDNAVSDVVEVLCEPDVGRPGREPAVLFHAAGLLARQHIQAIAVTACDGLFDGNSHAVVVDGNFSHSSLFVRSQSSEWTQRALSLTCRTRPKALFLPLPSPVSHSSSFWRKPGTN